MEIEKKYNLKWKKHKAIENTLYILDDDVNIETMTKWYIIIKNESGKTVYFAVHNTKGYHSDFALNVKTSKMSKGGTLYKSDEIKSDETTYPDYQYQFSNSEFFVIPEQQKELIANVDDELKEYIKYDEKWFAENFDSGITEEVWLQLLNDNEIFYENSLKLIRRLYDIGGEATCKQLANKYGFNAQSYNNFAVSLAKRIHKKTNCKLLERDNENAKWWPVLFMGRYADNRKEGEYIWKLRPELKQAIEEVDLSNIPLYEKDENTGIKQDGEYYMDTKPALNQILYGPPGTGKTYNTVIEAIKIIDNTIIKYDEQGKVINYPELKKKFDEYKKQGRIEFITFHQSYSYEEFVEGIKPDLDDNSKDLKYKLKDGIFKRMCKKPIATYEDFKKLFDEKLIQRTFKTSTDNEFEIVACDDSCIQTKRKSEDQVRKIEVKNFEQALKNEYDYKADTDGQLRTIIDYINEKNSEKKVLIIDEINRGNISKIFGELITLIEPDKRIGEKHELKVNLPYSHDLFGIPKNLYIIGTMNTADKSLALLDVALRRRFEFVPMYPKYEPEIKYAHIEYSNILNELNKNILKEKKSADYLIGHSYFMEDDSLENIFNHKVIPLLMEYFNGKTKDVQKLLKDIISAQSLEFDDKYKMPDKDDEYYYLQVKQK